MSYQLNKQALLDSLIKSLAKKWNPNKSNPLFGQAAAKRILRTGSTFVEPSFGKGQQGRFHGLADYLRQKDNSVLKSLGDKMMMSTRHEEQLADKALKNKIKEKFLILARGHHEGKIKKQLRKNYSKENIGGLYDKESLREMDKIDSSKLYEAKMFKGIGKTEILANILKQQQKGETIADTLNRVYGKKGWVAKMLKGQASLRTRGAKDANIYFHTDDNLSEMDKLTKRYGRSQLKKWIVQPNKNLQENSKVRQFLDNTLMPWTQPDFSGMKEYRVHVINGKVVPYATMDRGSSTRGVINAISPWRKDEIRKVEEYAQKQMSGLKNKHIRKGNFGFDVAIDVNGKPQLVEANPAATSGASGFLTHPYVKDAIQAAAAGRLPYHVMARRAIYGGAGLGATAYGLNKLKNNLNNPAQNQEISQADNTEKAAAFVKSRYNI